MKLKKSSNESICKICNSKAILYGVTDFNTSCYGKNIHRYNYPLSGHSIYYHKCEECGLVYTNAFDDWTDEDYKKHIYNDDYKKFDPNFNKARPEQSLKLLVDNFKELFNYQALDFGCGDGQLVKLLEEKGVNIVGWDPFHQDSPMPMNNFDFVTSFEVMEHVPDPLKTVKLIDQLIDQQYGKYFFSTLVVDGYLDKIMNNWYIAPRNGHITIYSKKSLEILFSKINMKVIHFSDLYHIAYKAP